MPSSSTAQMGATRRFCVRRAAVAAAWLAHVFSILGLNLADLIAATQPVTHRDDEEDDDDHHHPDPDPGSDLSESHEPDQIAPAAQSSNCDFHCFYSCRFTGYCSDLGSSSEGRRHPSNNLSEIGDPFR